MKNVNDYIPKLKELYPNVSESDLKKIVEYGWRMFYLYTIRGCDIILSSNKNKFWLYCGKLTYDSIKHFHYYRRKLQYKIRNIFKKKKRTWDGYYYTGLNNEEYEALIKNFNRVGRKKTYFYYSNKLIFKLMDEAKLRYYASKCIIKFKYITDVGYSYFIPDLKCTDVSIALERDHVDKFTDILVDNYKYEQL